MMSALLVLAAVAFWGGGFLTAARRGREVRRSLSDSGVQQRARIAELEASISAGDEGAPAEVRAEVERMLAPLLERGRASDELQANLRELLSPFTERERVGQRLAALEVPGGGRSSLARLLADIAACVGLETVLLSDADGLLLAAVGDDGSAVAVSGVSSMLVTFAERSVASGSSAPIAIMVHDEAHKLLLHRLFRVGDERYVLTAIARGRAIQPSTLDPALGKIEQLLAAAPGLPTQP